MSCCFVKALSVHSPTVCTVHKGVFHRFVAQGIIHVGDIILKTVNNLVLVTPAGPACDL